MNKEKKLFCDAHISRGRFVRWSEYSGFSVFYYAKREYTVNFQTNKINGTKLKNLACLLVWAKGIVSQTSSAGMLLERLFVFFVVRVALGNAFSFTLCHRYCCGDFK
jgi:hypothetical protein